MKDSLLESIGICLLRDGFTVKTLTRTCFDILARKASQILLIKILEDANSISQQYAEEMQRVSSYISGAPLIVSEKAHTKLEDNVVYSRFGIYTLNLATFRNCLHNKMPFVKSDHAGLTASVIGDKLKDVREKQGLSINSLAKTIGVSATMVKRYESGKADVTIAKAQKIYDVFGHNVFQKIDVFSEVHAMFPQRGVRGSKSLSMPQRGARNSESLSMPQRGARNSESFYMPHPKSEVGKKYESLGFDAAETKKVPFDLISRKDNELILTDIGDKPNPQSESLSKLIGADHLVIFSKKKPKDIPAVTKEEFMDFEKARQLIKFLKGFK